MTAVALLVIYGLGVLVGLLMIDARGPARAGLAILWPLGPLAFLATTAILLAASLVAFPLIGAIVIAVALAAIAFAQTPLQARFIGNMAYAISDGTTTLFTDFPYESGYSVYMTYDASDLRAAAPNTLALITHRHGDHWKKDLFDKTNWKVIAPEDALAGVASSRIVRSLPLAGSAATLTFNGISIEALPTPHARIGHYSYLVTWNGRRLYFTGDTEDASQLLAAKNIDLAFVSPWLFRSTQRSGRRIDARRVVIYHQTADETVPACTGTCSVPKQGETLLLR